MPNEEFASLESYEVFIREKIESWSPPRRVALATAMAERWLPAYETFSRNEDWGDPVILRQCLNAIWNTLSGQASIPVDWTALESQVRNITPHMDDFDSNEALCACAIIQYAIQCCTDDDNHISTVMAVLSGLEAARPDLFTGERVPSRLWKQAAVQKEISKQLQLIEQITALEDVTGAHHVLQPFLQDPQMVGELRKKSRRSPAGRTNQQVYRQFRQIIQLDMRGPALELDTEGNPYLAAILNLSAWMGRYSRRKQILAGEYGPLADQTAVTLLLARNQARDQSETAIPDWEPSTRTAIDQCYQNTMSRLGVDTPEGAHKYGPSLRRLWAEAKRRGLSDEEAWNSIVDWGRHQPETWEGKREASENPAVLRESLARPLNWVTTENPEIPWALVVAGESWEVRLNDFPDEIMYSLLTNGKVVGNFHDWPKVWRRDIIDTNSS